MTCEEVVLALDDAAGRELAPEIRDHVATCAACASYAAFLRDLADRVADLPREMTPPSDLWPGVQERLTSQRVTAFGRRRRRIAPAGQWWAAAAALLVGVGAGVLWTRSRPVTTPTVGVATTPATPASAMPSAAGSVSPAERPSAQEPSIAPAPLSPTATAAALPASYQTGADEFARATAELMAALEARKSTMTPETRAAVNRNLAVIDAALMDIRAALAKDPNNRDLLRLFGATRKRKIDTLRLVVKLTA